MKLALITQDFPPHVGGIQTYCSELAQRFQRSLTSFLVIAPGQPGARAWDRAHGLRVIRCPGGSDALPGMALLCLPALVAARQVDVVLHAQWQTLPASVGLRRLRRLRGLFVAAHGRELLLRPVAHWPRLQARYDRLRRAMLGAADRVFPVSRYTAAQVAALGVESARCRVVSNGTDPAHFRPLNADALRARLGLADRPVLLFVGRLQPNKGVDTVLAALPRIAAACPGVALVVIGEGEDQPRLSALARTYGVSDRTLFVGHVVWDELPLYYNLADLFITLSREAPPSVEGFGLVFLEASACGKAVIGARSGGIPDAVVDGETGRLIEPDDPAQLVACAVPLLRDRALRERLGAQGRARVLQRGHWDAVHDRLLASMQEVYGLGDGLYSD